MRAWLPEQQVYGPEPATERDVAGLNRVFADAFTDRYRRDGLVGVRVPYLNPQVWRYALLDAGAGSMLWRDESGHIVAFNIAHRSGTEGWMGPLAVRPDRQGGGVGKTIVRTAVDWLLEHRGRTPGLATLPPTARDVATFDAAIAATEAAAARLGIRRVAIRCQTRYDEAFRRLVARGYRVRWTDLRMTYEGYPEPHPTEGVLFSNWEI